MATANDEAPACDADKQDRRWPHASREPSAEAMYQWLALRRVHEVGATKLASRFLSRERPVADYLAETLDALIRTEHLALDRPDPIGAQQVRVTHAGQVKYTKLNSNAARHHSGGRSAQLCRAWPSNDSNTIW